MFIVRNLRSQDLSRLLPQAFLLQQIRSFSLSVSQLCCPNRNVDFALDSENIASDRKSKALLNEQKRIVKIAVLGVPNSGKSTLINQIMNRRVCSTSSKVHTTIRKSRAVCSSDDIQLIFLDTPGLVSKAESKRHNLKKSFLEDPTNSIREADLLTVVHDVSNKWTRNSLDRKVLDLLNSVPEKNSILVLNKIDVIKSKRMLLDLAQKLTHGTLRSWQDPKTNLNVQLTDNESDQKKEINESNGWNSFSEIFMVSALTGSGVGDIKEFMLMHAKPGFWEFSNDTYTDQSPQEIVELAVREKLMDHLPNEVPYNIKTKLELWEKLDSGMLCIVVLVRCPMHRYSRLLLRNNGFRIRMIAKEAEQALSSSFRCAVKLRVVVQDIKH